MEARVITAPSTVRGTISPNGVRSLRWLAPGRRNLQKLRRTLRSQLRSLTSKAALVKPGGVQRTVAPIDADEPVELSRAQAPRTFPVLNGRAVVTEVGPTKDGQRLALKISDSEAPSLKTQRTPGRALPKAGCSILDSARAENMALGADSAMAQSALTLGQSVALHSQTSTAVFSVLVLLLVGVIDYVSGPRLSFGAFYMVPVAFAVWFAGRKTGTAVALVAGVVWLAADLPYAQPFKASAEIWNFSSRVSVFVFVVQILAYLRALQLGLEETVLRRTSQLEIETNRRVETEREIAAVSHREQQRIAHELHDGLGQELGALAFQAKLLSARLNESASPLAKDAETLVQTLNQSTARTRALSHLLDPVGERSGTLRHALTVLADRSGQAFGIACTFDSSQALPQLSIESELNLYRIAQEAIYNAVQHGRATAVSIRAELDPGVLTLTIRDDGQGFSPENLPAASGGMGLRIMRYRSDALRARLDVHSVPGQGSTIVCIVPTQ